MSIGPPRRFSTIRLHIYAAEGDRPFLLRFVQDAISADEFYRFEGRIGASPLKVHSKISDGWAHGEGIELEDSSAGCLVHTPKFLQELVVRIPRHRFQGARLEVVDWRDVFRQDRIGATSDVWEVEDGRLYHVVPQRSVTYSREEVLDSADVEPGTVSEEGVREVDLP